MDLKNSPPLYTTYPFPATYPPTPPPAETGDISFLLTALTQKCKDPACIDRV